MIDPESDETHQVPGSGAERWVAASAGRGPTAEEEQAAERGAAGVDLESVAAHEQEMARLGAEVRGEGQIDSVTRSD
jgi:hypothetical protein